MTIDGKDVYTEWGCKLLEGSFDDLLKYPKRKAVKYNNWAEADGIDLDLSVVEFEPKTVKLKFLMKAETLEQFWSGYRKFVADLSGLSGIQSYCRYDQPLTIQCRLFSRTACAI